MRLTYDAALPITAHRDEILEALARHPVTVVCGATGSGKTTQLPKLCLEAGRGSAGLIGHTQPRRIAARALANRLAEELGTVLGDGLVGYQVRFAERMGPATRVKLMTDGILLKELESDRLLRRYDTLILDEAHERTLNIDLLLGIVKQLVPRRPELRTVITSATIDPGRFASFFGGAPVIEVSGRSYPVEVRYRPLVPQEPDEDSGELTLPEGIVAAVRELDGDARAMRGDALVFLPGEKHIREAARALEEARLGHTQILPLFARLSSQDQERIFARHSERRIVLATNVAETSLTVPGIRFVIDSGLARISRYSVRGKVQRLPIERISQASAEQRKGRCGRESEGICIRLYSAEEYERQPLFTDPEVLRTNLASVILRMATLGLGTPEEFPFLDPPDARLVNDGVRLLQELKAMDADRRVTTLGRQIAAIPVDPRLGRMLLAASRQGCLAEMLILAAFLEAQDPRERSAEGSQEAAREAVLADARSDFQTVLNLWRVFHERATELSRGQLRKWCREQSLSYLRMREWQELHDQLMRSIRELSLRPNTKPASYASLHQALLSGFLGSIGSLEAGREYSGPRGTRFVIAPGTPLASKPPRWVVAGSLLETTRLFARMVAAVDPGWIESAAAHLVKRTYTEPHWVSGRGFVAAFESVTLYGLTLAARRRIDYGAVAPTEAREVFIREALIAGNSSLEADFLHANRKSIQSLEALEDKIRRRDILAGEEAQVRFFAARLPERMSSLATFEHWWAAARRAQPDLLTMARADLVRPDAPIVDSTSFPDDWQVGGNRLPLEYRFEPGEPGDGVTLRVPEPLLGLLSAGQLAWGVPGMRLEKVTALLRALPKAVRKQLVPVPERARAALATLSDGSGADASALPDFHEWLAQWVSAEAATPVSAAQLAALPLAQHLAIRVQVLDASARSMAQGRDLGALRREIYGTFASTPAISGNGGRLTPARAPVRAQRPAQLVHRRWDFGVLPEALEVERGGLRWTVYPAVQDEGTGVAVVESRTRAEADAVSREGLTKLSLLVLPQQAKGVAQRMANDRELVLSSRGIPLEGSVAASLGRRVFAECFVWGKDADLPRDAASFAERLTQGRERLAAAADRWAALAIAIFREWRTVRASLERLDPRQFAAAHADIDAQMRFLLPPDLLDVTPSEWLQHLPRYLRALARRVERLPGNTRRDAELAAKVRPFVAGWHEVAAVSTRGQERKHLTRLRWMIEELRVSLFAQDLKTVQPVSEQRLAQQLEAARAEARG